MKFVRVNTDQMSFAFYFCFFKGTTKRHVIQLAWSAIRIPEGQRVRFTDKALVGIKIKENMGL